MFVQPDALMGQSERKYIREGNEKYSAGKYQEAEKAYRKAAELHPKAFEANFNTGDALYRQGKYEDAAAQFQALEGQGSKDQQAAAWHNLGNSLMKAEKYSEAVEAYKKSLRLQPNDEDTRFNLSWALQKLKTQPPQNNQNKDNKDNKDQKDQKQNNQGDKNDKNQQQNQQNKQQQGQDKQQQQAQQKQNSGVSKEDARRMLEALQQDERRTQERLQRQKAKPQNRNREKDW
jgi:tetratricopeptide (TPR) repeat protein